MTQIYFLMDPIFNLAVVYFFNHQREVFDEYRLSSSHFCFCPTLSGILNKNTYSNNAITLERTVINKIM